MQRNNHVDLVMWSTARGNRSSRYSRTVSCLRIRRRAGSKTCAILETWPHPTVAKCLRWCSPTSGTILPKYRTQHVISRQTCMIILMTLETPRRSTSHGQPPKGCQRDVNGTKPTETEGSTLGNIASPSKPRSSCAQQGDCHHIAFFQCKVVLDFLCTKIMTHFVCSKEKVANREGHVDDGILNYAEQCSTYTI